MNADTELVLQQLLSRTSGHEPVLSEKEQQILSLLDQEQDTRLEHALVEAQLGMCLSLIC